MDYKFLQAMTNRQLVKRYEALNNKTSKYCTWFIANGYGSLRPSDMRPRRNEHPKFGEYLDMLSEMTDIKSEAKRRYGPDFCDVRQLVYR